jgi:probable selenium-dependent hydroxylase accessory protein YqeC
VLTTTTKMGRSRTGGFPVLWAPSDDEVAMAMAAGSGPVLVWSEGDEHKVHGVTPEMCDRWFRQLGSVVVEADGSRRKPFKAPLHYEPVVPRETTVLVACVGVDALGAVIADGCHRPSVVAEVAGCAPDDRLTPARLATVLTSSRGSAKGRPPGARFAVLINQVADRHLDEVAEVARLVVDRIPEAIVVAVAPHTPDQSPG